MSDGKLVLNDMHDRHFIRISWFFPEEDDYGVNVGDDYPMGPTADEIEMRAIHDAVKPLADGKDDSGFRWESKTRAQRALTVAKAAQKAAHSTRPMEEWESKAIAAGWKPPKGWR